MTPQRLIVGRLVDSSTTESVRSPFLTNDQRWEVKAQGLSAAAVAKALGIGRERLTTKADRQQGCLAGEVEAPDEAAAIEKAGAQ
jgi:hypothetical protein